MDDNLGLGLLVVPSGDLSEMSFEPAVCELSSLWLGTRTKAKQNATVKINGMATRLVCPMRAGLSALAVIRIVISPLC